MDAGHVLSSLGIIDKVRELCLGTMRYSTEPREQYEVLRFVLRLLGSRCFFLGGRLTEIPFQPSTCGSFFT